jgi:predicted MFS family arabinose efflux permease
MTPPVAAPVRAARLMTAALAVMTWATFGTLAFTFSVMLGPMTEELGWSNALLSSGYTVGAVVAGALAAFVGRTIDVNGGRAVAIAGSFVGAAGVLLWSFATTPAIYLLAWMVMGAGMALGLYEPAFASVLRHAPGRRRESVLTITLAGAVASTVYIPLAQFLVSRSDWRVALMQIAALYLAVTLPFNLLAMPRRGAVLVPDDGATTVVASTPDDAAAVVATDPGRSQSAVRTISPSLRNSSELRRVALVTVLGHSPTVALGTHLVAFLIVGGRSPAAAAALAAGLGIGKLLGRLSVGAAMRWFGSYRLLIACHAAIGAALLVPLFVPPGPLDLAMIAALGMGAGSMTVVRPLYIADLFGSVGFGLTSGRINRVNKVATAFVPLAIGAIVTLTGGYTIAWAVLAVGALAGTVILPPVRSRRETAVA